MKKISLVALSFAAFLPIITFAQVATFNKVNFKRAFCNNHEFLGNAASKRPHLHCGSNFISYKKANGDHSKITEAGNCNRTNAVFDDIKANKVAFADYQSIYNALVSYHQADCPN